MKSSKQIKQGIADSLRRKMLSTSLWGVLDISMLERRYEIIEVVDTLMFNDQFKADGFKVRLIDYNNFVQKIPHFSENDEFIRKHDLMFNGEPSYQAYLAHMNKMREKYAKQNSI